MTEQGRAAAAFAEFVARGEAGESISFDAFCAERPAIAAELRRRYEVWRAETDELSVLDAAHPAARAAPRAADRYRVQDELGRGGMGVVHRAEDADLGRHVALKRLESGDASSLRRFFDEARTTGQLEHPGIVPVYEIGVDAEERAFFTMRLVEGDTFKQIIERVHTGGGDWTLARALGTLLRVCEAVAYAHEKGVLHRDLKPSNIMVGRFGEAYVMDWGLARSVEDGDERVPRSIVSGRRAAEDTDSALLTQEGQVVGTPAYMAPEQARGDRAAVDRRTDVYALGTILYHLLAGRMPYAESGDRRSDSVLEQVRRGPPPALPAGAGIAPDLVAITDKAMAREPDGRYQTVGELAGDLRSFLEGRVVAAHEAGTWAELRKWIGRNRALTASCAAGILLLIAGLVTALLLGDTARSEAARADAGFDLAFEAIDDLTVTGWDGLASIPGTLPLRRRLMNRVLEFHRRLLATRGTVRSLALARSHYRVAWVERQLGNPGGAARAARDAVAMFDALLEEEPGHRQLRSERGNARQFLGEVLTAAGDHAGARRAHDAAAKELRRLVGEEPRSLTHRRRLARTLNGLAMLSLDGQRYDEAVSAARETIRVIEARAGERDDPDRRYLAAAHAAQGLALAHQREWIASGKALRRAIAALEEIAAKEHDDTARLASCWIDFGKVLRSRERFEPADRALQKAEKMLVALVTGEPGATSWRAHLGRCLAMRAEVAFERNEFQAAAEYAARAVQELRTARAAEPGNPVYRGNLAFALLQSAYADFELGEVDRAVATTRLMVPLLARFRVPAARILAQASTRESVRERGQALRAEAMRHLEQAAAAGDLAASDLDSAALAPLAELPEFAALRERLSR